MVTLGRGQWLWQVSRIGLKAEEGSCLGKKGEFSYQQRSVSVLGIPL